MRKNIVLTLTGPDRVGIVETVTRLLLDHGGNVETSRMVRLGGEFAILLLVSMPAGQQAGLEHDLASLIAAGYRVTITPTGPGGAQAHPGWPAYQIQVHGADHEGIVHQIAHYFSQHGINVEAMDTGTTRAPHSGAPLFTMTAVVATPPDLANQDWAAELEELGCQLNVEVTVLAIDRTR